MPAASLIVTADAELLDELLRLAAAADVEPVVAADALAARTAWSGAPLVVVGGGAAAGCVAARLPRRAGVVLVGAEGEDLWRLATELGADHVVFLPAAEPWLVDRFADSAAAGTGSGRLVAVLGGRGGAGATVLAAALAVTAQRRGARTLLVDADPLGGGIDLVLGGEDATGVRWPELSGTSGRLAAPGLYAALPRVDDLCVLSWDRGDVVDVPAAALMSVLAAARRGADVVVIDLPRRTDDAAAAVLREADVALLVVPAEVRACAAAARVAAQVARHCSRLELVVRGPAPARLGSRDVAATLGLPLAGVLRPEPGLGAALERGEPPGGDPRSPLGRFCAGFLTDLDAAAAAA